jgi:O-antigen ligase
VIELLLVLALLGAALAFGAVYPWAYWPLAAVAAVLGAWALWRGRGAPSGLPRPFLAALAAVGTAMALQALPVPHGVFTALSPAADRFLRQYDLAYAANPSGWHSVALDPAAALTSLALFAALTMLLAGLARSGAVHWDRLLGGLVLAGLALALFGVIQRAALPPDSLHKVYGVWESQFKGDPFGPFINRNHFAGWMIMGVGMSMGYSLAVLERSPRPRGGTLRDWMRWLTTPEASRFAFVVFAVLAMATALALSRSRSGVVGLLVAAVVLTVAMARRASGSLKRGLAVTYGVALVGGAVAWAGLSATMTRLATAPVDLPTRLSAWQDTLRIVADFPWFGVGLGSYGTAMLVYQSAHRDTMFAQAHNDYLQLAAEGGLLVAVPAAVVLWLGARTVARRLQADSGATTWMRVGAIAAIAGIAAQSLVEFSLQMPANAALFTVAAALALHAPRRSAAHAHRV